MLTRHTFHIFIFQFPSWIRTKYTPSRQHTWTCNFVEYICLVSLDIDLLFDIFRMDKLFFFLYYISFQILTCFNFTSTENITTSNIHIASATGGVLGVQTPTALDVATLYFWVSEHSLNLWVFRHTLKLWVSRHPHSDMY